MPLLSQPLRPLDKVHYMNTLTLILLVQTHTCVHTRMHTEKHKHYFDTYFENTLSLMDRLYVTRSAKTPTQSHIFQIPVYYTFIIC